MKWQNTINNAIVKFSTCFKNTKCCRHGKIILYSYKDHTKEDLTKKCHSLRIPISAAVTKLQLVQLIGERNGVTPTNVGNKYTGVLKSVPTASTALNRPTVEKLRDTSPS